MCNWTTEQKGIIQAAKEGRISSLGLIPRYKCYTCHLVLAEDQVDMAGGKGPVCELCQSPVVEMCALDHYHCSHAIVVGVEYCPICGQAICPTCGSHDVSQISRVTGYLSDVQGWNKAKAQELKDRSRYDLVGTETMSSAIHLRS